MIISNAASAQFTISQGTASSRLGTRSIKDSIRNQSSISNRYYSEARYRAERRRIRHERNFVKFTASLTVNQTQYENWTKGGENTFSGLGTLYFNHKYSKKRFNIEYVIDAQYGQNVVDKKSFKNTDYFRFNPSVGFDITDRWSYSAAATLKSQFANGYKSRTDSTLVSAFMAPGTITLSVGITYQNKKKDPNFKVQMSPIGGNMTTVFNKELSDKGAHGLKAGQRTKNTFGSSLQIDLNYKFVKDKIGLSTYFFTFSNYRTNTFSEIRNSLDFSIAKFLKISTFVNAVYDRLAEIPGGNKIQLNYRYGLTLAYTFQNKDK